jgi:hypothetical protein
MGHYEYTFDTNPPMGIEPGDAGINALTERAYAIVKAKGFSFNKDNHFEVLAKMGLVAEELGEAITAYRETGDVHNVRFEGPDGKPEGVPIELVDIMIRCMTMLHQFGHADVARLIEMKLRYNETRAFRHGKFAG